MRLIVMLLLAFPIEGARLNAEPERPVQARYNRDDPRFMDIARDLRCPTCTGVSVLDSDAPFSVQIKNLVQEQVEKGRSRDQVLEFFVDRYGPWILREPPKSGVNLVAWVIPIALLFFGPFFVWLNIWRRPRPAAIEGVRPAHMIVAEMHRELGDFRRKHKR